MRAVHRDQRGLRGVIRLGRLIPFADGAVESAMESRMRWRFLAGGLPAPRVQVEVADGSRCHRLDVGHRRHERMVDTVARYLGYPRRTIMVL